MITSLGFGGDAASSATSYPSDPHAVSKAEAQSFFAGLPSEPVLLYRTGKEQWSPPRGPEAQRRLKEVHEVFTHPITNVWNHDLGWKVVEVMDARKIRFTTIDVVRFKKVYVDEAPEDEEEGEAKKPVVGPVTIWIGVSPESTSATAAHDAAQAVLALLEKYQITDVDIDFRESLYTRKVGPPLREPVGDLDPLVDAVGPLTPALGLRISTTARPNTQGTMAVYVAEGGINNHLLGLSCRHVLIDSKEANIDYVRHPSMPRRDVLLLGSRAFTDLVGSVELRIEHHGVMVKRWKKQIEGFEGREEGTNTVDVEEAKAARVRTQVLLEDAEEAMEALRVLLNQIYRDWKKLDNRVLGHILYSTAIALGVGEHRFT